MRSRVTAKGIGGDAHRASGRRAPAFAGRSERIPLVTAGASSRCWRHLRAGREPRTRPPRDVARGAGDRQEPRREEFISRLARRDPGAHGPLEPVRGGGRVRAARADDLPRDRPGRRDVGGRRSPERLRASVQAWVEPRRDEADPASGAHAGSRRGRERREPLSRRRGARRLLGCCRAVDRRPGRDGVRGSAQRGSAPARPARAASAKEPRRLPLMVVCVARWELLDDRPNWAGGIADAVTSGVEPLTPAHAPTGRGGRRPRRRDAERIASHAGGNPYFIVEIAGHAPARGARPAARPRPRRALGCCPRPSRRSSPPDRPAESPALANSCAGPRSSRGDVSTSTSWG